MIGRCPVTAGLPTRMSRSSFAVVCAAKRLAAIEAAEVNKGSWQWSRCLECGGDDMPPELTLEEDIMAAKKYIQGTCEVCEKQANITKSNGRFVCSTCEHIVRAVRNKPDVVRRLMRETYGDDSVDVAEIKEANASMENIIMEIKAAIGVLDDTPDGDLPGLIEDLMRERGEYAAEINKAMRALDCGLDEDLAEVADRRIGALRKLDKMYLEASERAEKLERKLDKMRSGVTTSLEVKRGPADHLPITSLLTDKNLLAAINTLADALEEV